MFGMAFYQKAKKYFFIPLRPKCFFHKLNEQRFKHIGAHRKINIFKRADEFEVKNFAQLKLFDDGKTMHLRPRSMNKWVLQLMVKREKFHYHNMQHMHITQTHRHTRPPRSQRMNGRAHRILTLSFTNTFKWAMEQWGSTCIHIYKRKWVRERKGDIFRLCYLQYLINVFAMTCTVKERKSSALIFFMCNSKLDAKSIADFVAVSVEMCGGLYHGHIERISKWQIMLPYIERSSAYMLF